MLETKDSQRFKPLAIALAILSLLTLIVTAWVLINVRHEQAIVTSLINHLQGSDLQVANELSSELGLQKSLSLLLVLNVVAAAVAFSFVIRGYFSSERNLKDVKVLSADILASMDIGVITTDMDGRIISVNPRAIELLGISPSRLVENIKQFGPEHVLLNSICKEMVNNHHSIRDRDYRFQRSGHGVTLRAGCTMLRNRRNEEIGMVLHVRDVSEKILMEERLRRMERYMGLGSLAAGLQHEIKNPLSALSLHIQILCERLQSLTGDVEVNEILVILNTEVKRIGGVLDGFRNYASIHEIGRTPVNVLVVLEKLVRLLRPDAEQKSIKLVINSTPEATKLIQADESQLEQVLLNLALNAVAAMSRGGILRFSLSDQEGKLRIDVSDSGNGIPPEIQSRVFDPYFTTRSDGMGMGLALCDKIVRQHDGSIYFETNSSGTTFTILLPIQPE